MHSWRSFPSDGHNQKLPGPEVRIGGSAVSLKVDCVLISSDPVSNPQFAHLIGLLGSSWVSVALNSRNKIIK